MCSFCCCFFSLFERNLISLNQFVDCVYGYKLTTNYAICSKHKQWITSKANKWTIIAKFNCSDAGRLHQCGEHTAAAHVCDSIRGKWPSIARSIYIYMKRPLERNQTSTLLSWDKSIAMKLWLIKRVNVSCFDMWCLYFHRNRRFRCNGCKMDIVECHNPCILVTSSPLATS